MEVLATNVAHSFSLWPGLGSGKMEDKHGSWSSLVSFCAVTAVCAALGFGGLFAGAAVIFAAVQPQSVSAEESSQPLPQDSLDGNQITEIPASSEPQLTAVAWQSEDKPAAKDPNGTQSFSGMVTDARCGARHARNSNKTPADCATECVRKGSHYVLVDGEEIHGLHGDRTQLDRMAGMRVDVVGKIVGDTIKVQSMTAHHD